MASQNNKKNNNTYQDPLRKFPVKACAYSNEIGAVVSGISPKIGTALWVPALMYFGADIYDKYKNDETSYNPSKRRGFKEAVFQSLASVLLPTAAVKAGQRAFSTLNRVSQNKLSTQAKEDVIEKSLSFMQSKSLHTYENNPQEYVNDFKDAILMTAKDSKGDFKALSKSKKIMTIINPFKDCDNIAFSNENYLSSYAEKQAEKIMQIRSSLMKNEKPKELSNKLFKKFQDKQGEYKKIYPEDKYLGKAAKSILKQFHKEQIFKNKLIKTAGGFVALLLLIKPIDDFVEHFVIQKTVEPGLEYLSKNLKKQTKSN
jgi:hypothetical protein